MSDAPHVVIGATGMLGRAVVAELRGRGIEPLTPTRAEVDLAQPDSIDALPMCEALFNCAAWTDVDGAEAHESEATVINGKAVSRLAMKCSGGLVTFGTDYVFDGRGESPYKTDAKRDPINAYGRAKAAGEQLLESSSTSWLNIRTSWLYAPWANNFVLTMRRLMHERESLKVVDDQRGRPTSVEHLARASVELWSRGETGHWHATDGGECTWYEFASEIKKLTGAPATIEPCTTDEFPRPARRPAYSVLDLSQTEAELGPMPHWKDNLADVLRRVPEGITNA
ncbi:MAG: dTDP-4-dehydrorhamnose reductase [Phycisphaerales bacterium]